MNSTNILLHAKDIQFLTGKSQRFGQNVISEVWEAKGKQKQRWISIADFCQYFNMSEATVLKILESLQQGKRI